MFLKNLGIGGGSGGGSGVTPGSGSSGFTQGAIPFADSSGALTQDASNLVFTDATNRLGVGVAAPSVTGHFVTTDAVTNATTDVVYVDHATSGTAAAGLGTGIVFRGEDDAGTMTSMARVAAVYESPEDTLETAHLSVGLVLTGTLAQTHLFTPGGFRVYETTTGSYALFSFSDPTATLSLSADSTHWNIVGRRAAGDVNLTDVILQSHNLRTAGYIARIFNNSREVASFTFAGKLRESVLDTATNTVSDVLELVHLSSGTAAASYGTGILIKGQDAAGNEDDMARISTLWTDATSTSEDSNIVFFTRTAGAALAENFRIANGAITSQSTTNTNAMRLYTSGTGTGASDGSEISVSSSNAMRVRNWEAAAIDFITSGGSVSWSINSSGHLLQTGGNRLGFDGLTAPTHPATFPISSTGIAFYNTSDVTTNYERAVFSFSGNVFGIRMGIAGTGTARSLALLAQDGSGFTISNFGTVVLNGSSGGQFLMPTASDGVGVRFTTRMTSTTASAGFAVHNDPFTSSNGLSAASGTQTFASFTATVNQSGSAGYNGLLVNITETSVGSGFRSPLLVQVGGTTVFGVFAAAVNTVITARNVTGVDYPNTLTITGGAYSDLTNNEGGNDIFIDLTATANYVGGGAAMGAYRGMYIRGRTLTADAAQTITRVVGLQVDPPIASTNITATNLYAAYFGGLVYLGGNGTQVIEVPNDTTAGVDTTIRGRWAVKMNGATYYVRLYND